MNINDVFLRRRLPPPEQYYGVEIEVEGVTDSRWASEPGSFWAAKEDGSLRNSGAEFITEPIRWKHLMEAVGQYYYNHKECGYQPSIRTGIHVHVDMRFRTAPEVLAICCLYAYMEPLLMRMCGPSREECVYCVPWYRAPDNVALLRQFMSEMSVTDRDRAQVYGSRTLNAMCKYSALYVEPLRRFGTIEFRSAPTYEREEDLVEWLSVIRRLVEVGIDMGTPESVRAMVKEDFPAVYMSVFEAWENKLSAIDARRLLRSAGSTAVASSLVRTSFPDKWKHKFEPVMENVGALSARQTTRVRLAPNPFGNPEQVRAEYDDSLELEDDDDYDPDYEER